MPLIDDVIIVGAGPAGTVLAYHLASAGLRVQILEKEPLPRYKTCGGGLSTKAFQSLPFDIDPVIEHKAAGGIMAYKGRRLLKVDTARPIASLVQRDRFDHYLAKKAVAAGAALCDGEAVKAVEIQDDSVSVKTQRQNYRGRILVGADGVHSLVARAAGLLGGRQIGVALEAEIAVPGPALEKQGAYATFDFGALPHGYGWIFPKRDHLSVGIFQAKATKAPTIRRFFDEFVSNHKVLDGHTLLGIQGHHIPLGGGRSRLQRGPVLLVGDAANLADAWLGEGLYYAIQSAVIAAQVIKKAFEAGNVRLDAYNALIHAQILLQLDYARIFGRWVYAMPRIGMHLTRKSEFMQDAVFGVMRGDITFRELIPKLLVGLPLILVQTLGSRKPVPAYRRQK